jgi:hypothetical protein
MTKSIVLTLIVTIASAMAGCGRDDNQEKIGGAAATPETAGAVGMPDGTRTGGRTTAPPK